MILFAEQEKKTLFFKQKFYSLRNCSKKVSTIYSNKILAMPENDELK